MRRRATIATALAGLTVAGCGSGGVHEIAHWKSEAPYLPPPELRADSAPGQPVAGASTPAGRSSRAPTDAEVARDLERAFGPGGARAVDAAGLTGDGLATIPPSAPARVAAIIRAGNSVARKPYVYGGGHGRVAGETFIDSAYDCSGSVSFALAAAGLVGSPMDSTALSRYGRSGPGRWVTIYANGGHAWMTVAGLRFDTSGRAERGSRWQSAPRGTVGFTVRHPPGL
ncbi:MAG: peptidoglycan DL-endopeptidase RipB [Solirubrobacteraceae bacterium]|jgi:hypothetical protein|nr:peptidoglycan DL-endopeptidase RipB [Solirubrobacteraceae bacterium]